MGGISGEREVSLASGAQVARALRESGHEVVAVDTGHGVLTPTQERAILDSGIRDPHPPEEEQDLLRTGDLGAITSHPLFEGTEVVFVALHGGRGEDGTVQALLHMSGIPFVGSDRVGCALAMDKDLSKRLFRDAVIPTPAWISVNGREEGEARLGEISRVLRLPVIVKPPSGGSTLGLSLAHDEEELGPALELALEYEDRVLFEAYVPGRELTVGILGDQTLPVGEIIPEHELFDYECKYRDGMAQEIFPADLPVEIAERLQAHALAAHRALRLRDFSRVDFILGEDGTPWCLEANALPGLTGNSLLPKGARAAGISFPDLCESLANMALARGQV
ncbi:MAG: D-alanine--D-alanine ligase [Gemmatimonadetes bacterium]|nr:D-alanine--D-alanine ligase [Gemmatimonadota bacterium]